MAQVDGVSWCRVPYVSILRYKAALPILQSCTSKYSVKSQLSAHAVKNIEACTLRLFSPRRPLHSSAGHTAGTIACSLEMTDTHPDVSRGPNQVMEAQDMSMSQTEGDGVLKAGAQSGAVPNGPKRAASVGRQQPQQMLQEILILLLLQVSTPCCHLALVQKPSVCTA